MRVDEKTEKRVKGIVTALSERELVIIRDALEGRLVRRGHDGPVDQLERLIYYCITRVGEIRSACAASKTGRRRTPGRRGGSDGMTSR